MSKTKETERATEWGIVLNKPPNENGGFNIKTLYSHLKSAYTFVAIIEHDQDLNENGDLKTIHYHAVIKTPRMRKQTLLNDLKELLNLPENTISIEKIKNLRASLRYLTHLDDEDKISYPPFMVITNDQNFYNDSLIERIENITTEELIKVVDECITTRKILLKIGLENYKKWAKVINDLQRTHE